ncbi:DUF226 domain-containing protein [Borrelia duttonii]|uniref:Plasmid partitioning associated protein-1 n=1 Tax=Borrelia duttonii (strain Ly) TaxID=412419 RepID=B5RPH2_BORDL|nr:plasmid partitioning associated protein-1 [Borrelia duttonii Ly]
MKKTNKLLTEFERKNMICQLKNLESKPKKNFNDSFSKIEKEDARTIYHTKIFNDLFAFGVNRREEDKFFVALRGVFNSDKKSTFRLFSIEKEEDRFLGMFYGFKRLKTSFILRYKDDTKKSDVTTKIYKPYYIEFRFKKGSIFCYIKAIHSLIKKEKFTKKYVQTLLERIMKLEDEVYKFYDKRLPDGGIITKWIEKNQR